MRSVTPQISVQQVNGSPQIGGYAQGTPSMQRIPVSPATAHMQQQQQQRAHLAAQQQAAHQQQQIQHMHGQQQRQHAGQQAAAMQANIMHQQKVAADLQLFTSALCIANCDASVLSNALWATGLANRHPESWNDAERVSFVTDFSPYRSHSRFRQSRALESYNVMLEESRKDSNQQKAQQRSFGDSGGGAFQRPQSIVPASPSSAGRQNMAFR